MGKYYQQLFDDGDIEIRAERITEASAAAEGALPGLRRADDPESDYLDLALAFLDYEPLYADDGSLVEVAWSGYMPSWEGENALFAAIAPFVTAGSAIAFREPDGDVYRYYFDGQNMAKQLGTIAWPTMR
jgi:hypothetical protein